MFTNRSLDVSWATGRSLSAGRAAAGSRCRTSTTRRPFAATSLPADRGWRSGANGDALLLEELLQFAGLEHFADDVAAADKLALDVELRDRRPVREFLDPLAYARVGQHVDAFELDPDMAEDLHHSGGKPALRKDRRSLHEQHDGGLGDVLADTLLNRVVHFSGPRVFRNGFPVIPAQAGIQGPGSKRLPWTPAFAGVTNFSEEGPKHSAASVL